MGSILKDGMKGPEKLFGTARVELREAECPQLAGVTKQHCLQWEGKAPRVRVLANWLLN